MTLWWSHLPRSRDKLKPFYLHYHSPYGHQLRQDADLLWVALTYKVTRPFDHVVLQYLVTNYNQFIYNTTVPMASKPSRLDTYRQRIPSYNNRIFNQVMLLDHVTIWKIYVSLSSLTTTKMVGWLSEGGLTRKHVSRHQLLVRLSFSTLIWDGLIKVFCIYSNVC